MTTGKWGRCGCSRARRGAGPSRAQNSSALAPPAAPSRATAWRCRPTGTPRSSAVPKTMGTREQCGCSRAGGAAGPSRPEFVGTGAAPVSGKAGGQDSQGSSVALRPTGTPRSSAHPGTPAGTRMWCGYSRAPGGAGPRRGQSFAPPRAAAAGIEFVGVALSVRRQHCARRWSSTTMWRRHGCSRARGGAGPSRAQGSSVPALPASTAATWRCRPMGTPRSSQPIGDVGVHALGEHLDSAGPQARTPRGGAWHFRPTGTRPSPAAAGCSRAQEFLWTQQGSTLFGTGEIQSEPSNVALSSDGNTALVGGIDIRNMGAVWVFVRPRA